MYVTKVVDNICQITANVEDILFEGLWEIPNGVSINSFIVKGEKTALIDGVGNWGSISEDMMKKLKDMDMDLDKIDYIVINHMEPDHSGWLEDVIEKRPDMEIVCGQKSADLLDAFFDIKDNIRIVKTGDTLDLGNGYELEFVEIPNVHWPDTIASFEKKTGTLFSCDAFGAFGKVPEENYDDKLTEEELAHFEKEAVRYYSNIVASFSTPVNKAVEKCSSLPIKIIAPGHGIVWRKDPERIVNDYLRYASYQKGVAKDEITVIWGSMYGMTKKSVDFIEEILKREGVNYHIHEVPKTHWGEIMSTAWTSTGIILAMPTYEYKMFPPMAAALEELGKKKFVGRKAFRVGSYGWSGGAEKELDEIMTKYRMNWDFIESVEFKGKMRDEEKALIEERVLELIGLVKETVENR